MLLWLFEAKFNEKYQLLKSPFFILSIGFYLLHLVGMFYTNNMEAGSFDLEQKLSLLIFPLLFFSDPHFNHESLIKVLKSFVLGCVLAGIICGLNAFLKYYLSGESDVFFYAHFSVIMHTSYFAMYLVFAIILLLFNDYVIRISTLRALILMFFILLIVLTSSKSGLFSLGIVLMSKFIYDIFIHKSYLRVFVLFTILFFSAITIYFLLPKSFERLSEMKQNISNSRSEINTTTSRIAIWKHASKIISKHYLIGVGTGDVKDALKSEYDKQTVSEFGEKKLNAHNQYLQTFIALGLPGLLILLSLLSVIVYFTYRHKMLDGTLFTTIISFNMLFESMLETQAGVVFIAFFLMLYLSEATKYIRTKNTNIVA